MPSRALLIVLTFAILVTMASGQLVRPNRDYVVERERQAAILADAPPEPKGGDTSAEMDDEAFLAAITGHANEPEQSDKSDKRLIVMVTNFSGGNECHAYTLSAQGNEEDWRDMYNWAEQGRKTEHLSRDELSQVHEALKQLPPSITAPTPHNHLALVSYEDGSNWVSHWYDETNPPAPLQQILKIFTSHQNN